MKISAKTRDEAILVLELCASNDVALGDLCSGEVYDVVFNAYLVIPHKFEGGDFDMEYLEAAALLRDGWSPGVEVYLLNRENS